MVNYPTGTTDISFQYDALNRVTTMVDATGTTTYTYSNGLLQSENGPWNGDTVSYAYNTARQRNQLVILQPTGNAWTNTYAWDAARRLSGVTSPAGTHTYLYDTPGSRVRSITLPGGLYLTNDFDSLSRLANTEFRNSAHAILNRHGYAYNAGHQRTTLSRTNSTATGWNGYSTATYDGAGEVREVKAFNASGVSVPSENFFYGHDFGWNMLKRTNNAFIATYTPNVLNQAAGTYDARGNRISGTDSYTYDAENQLIQIEQASSWKRARIFHTLSAAAGCKPVWRRWPRVPRRTVCPHTARLGTASAALPDGLSLRLATKSCETSGLEFVYDGRQRLRIIRDFIFSGGSYVSQGETRLVYDGLVPIQERTSSSNPTVTYTRGTDFSGTFEGAGGIGGLLARSTHSGSNPFQPSSHAFYHADGNGNVTYLTRADASAVGVYKYDPFGRTLATSGTLASANRMRFSSKPWVQSASGSSGYYAYGYRFYDPTSQRWLNRDPIHERGSVNMYAILKNSPIRYIDRFGLKIEIDPSAPSEFKDRNGACLCVLKSSPFGKSLFDRVNNEPETVTIKVGDDPLAGPSFREARRGASGGVMTVEVYPQSENGISPETQAKMEQFGEDLPNSIIGCAVMLGHEFGHLLGSRDNPLDGNNVWQYENPIQWYFDLKTRTSYRGESVIPNM